MHWDKIENDKQIHQIIEKALDRNLKYSKDLVLGLPGSHLDSQIFKSHISQNETYWKLLRENPNHIGCHTHDQGESAFTGTQDLERELIKICAEEILSAKPRLFDGYVATGGTEANIQALWLLRNKYITEEYGFDLQKVDANTLQAAFLEHLHEIDVIYSQDTHYSFYKGAHLLNLHQKAIPVDYETRQMDMEFLSKYLDEAKEAGRKFFIVILNMGTTMFGSIDNIDPINKLFAEKGLQYAIHVDAAFGGFIYPFTNPDNKLTFQNKHISSFTLDAHKMLQAPYSTGIFVTRRKDNGQSLMDYVTTGQASYVEGHDSTLCGSRSGANAVAVWMILKKYGSEGGKQFCQHLLSITDYLCEKLDKLGIKYFRNPHMNIVTMETSDKIEQLKEKYCLVPDSHSNPKWYKIVVMDHVKKEMIDDFVRDLAS